MGRSVSVVFTSTSTWTAPASVSAVWLTECGGGAAVPGSVCGGGGSAELVTNRLIPVIPGHTYTVTVGSKGIGNTTTGFPATPLPTPPGFSEFAGFVALGAGVIFHTSTFGGETAGSGGGCGGRFVGEAEGHQPYGVAEARHAFGGAGGSYGINFPSSAGVHGGTIAQPGAAVSGNNNSGGAGAGTLWGGTTGGTAIKSDYVPPPVAGTNFAMNADQTHYGAGAGGNGSDLNGGSYLGVPYLGGDAVGGVVMLTWVGPQT